jgi:small subunit ribosomal protein S4
MRIKEAKCRICRRLGVKLFLRGERCFSPKCAMVKRPYPPGQKGKRRPAPPSEYKRELVEKQKLKYWYNLSERQLRKYVKEVLEMRGKVEDASVLLIQNLEKRLDNVVYRLGFAVSRDQARQMVSHNFFLVNGKSVNIPSYRLKVGDVISLKPQKLKKVIFKDLKEKLKRHSVPSWLFLDPEKLEGKIIAEPKVEEIAPPVEVSSVFEFYSR